MVNSPIPHPKMVAAFTCPVLTHALALIQAPREAMVCKYFDFRSGEESPILLPVRLRRWFRDRKIK